MSEQKKIFIKLSEELSDGSTPCIMPAVTEKEREEIISVIREWLMQVDTFSVGEQFSATITEMSEEEFNQLPMI